MRPVAWAMAGLLLVLVALDLATSGSEPVAPRRAAADVRFSSRPDLRPPVLTVSERKPGTAPGEVFLAPKRSSGQSGPAILDERGDYVWFRPSPKGVVVDDFRVQTYRGASVLTWWEGKTSARGYGEGTWVIADRSYREIARIRAGRGLQGDLHELELTDRGTALIPIYHAVKADLRPVGAYADGEAVDSIIQEVDVASGKVLWEWHSLDHVAITESLRRPAAEDALPVRLLPYQLDRRRPRRQPAGLRPQHLGDLQAGPQDRRRALAPRRLPQRLRARQGRALRLAA